MRPLRDAPRVLAVFCSGGPHTRFVDEFLEGCLRLDGADWLAIPGGPAVLAGRTVDESDETFAWREVAFLVEHHHIAEAVLIFHEDCGHYHRHLGKTYTVELERSLQDADASAVVAGFAERFPGVSVTAYHQFVDDTASYFGPMNLGAELPPSGGGAA
jgi:hypothetical protein